MKATLLILISFVLGVMVAAQGWIAPELLQIDWAHPLLLVMMFLVGISIGGDLEGVYRTIRQYSKQIVLLPLATLVGTLFAMLLFWLISPQLPLRESVAVGSGFGYYTLSAVYLKELAGEDIGVMSLISNLTREIITLLFAPLIATYFGRLAPISAGGSTSIDTALPVISRYCGEGFVVISIFHGFVIDLCVPLILTLLYS